jgi:hypothetical protein
MMTRPPTVPVSCWLYYFNVGDIDAALERVKAGGGQVLRDPIEVLDGNWIVQCADPQGAIFALAGHRGFGYFERVGSRQPKDDQKISRALHSRRAPPDGVGAPGLTSNKEGSILLNGRPSVALTLAEQARQSQERH